MTLARKKLLVPLSILLTVLVGIAVYFKIIDFDF